MGEKTQGKVKVPHPNGCLRKTKVQPFAKATGIGIPDKIWHVQCFEWKMTTHLFQNQGGVTYKRDKP